MGLKEAFRRLTRHHNTTGSDDHDALLSPDDSELPELRHAPSLEMAMCRYVNGVLRKETVILADTKYIAISHVWGDARWQKIDGVKGKIIISDEKAKFLREQMPELVGEEFFWMDILCIDQRDEVTRVAVTQYIPAIFRRAQHTIAIRQGEGIRSCCYQAANFPSDRKDLLDKMILSPYLDRLQRHYKEKHVGEDCATDGMISRLWPFQELLVSDTIRFVQCRLVPRTPSMGDSFQPSHSEYDRLLGWTLMQIALMGNSWAVHRNRAWDNITLQAAAFFVDAYLSCGVATRTPTTRTLVELDYHLAFLKASARRTTKPRDFILAIMPQYAFYTVPDNAKDLSFGALFIDCTKQMRKISNIISNIEPFYMGLIPSLRPEDIPEPLFLGDFAKLFGNDGGTVSGPFKRFSDAIEVKVEDANDLQ